MAKRFIDSELFKKNFIRGIKAPYKLLWVYLFCDCTHAGIWECEFDVAESRLQQKIDWGQAKKIFADKIIEIENGSKWFFPEFIDFQYGQLSEKNPAHNNIIKILKKYSLIDGALKVVISPFQGTKEKEKETDKEENKEKEKVRVAHLFSESEFFDKQKFIAAVEKNEKYLCFDMEYYYEKIVNWSAEGNKKKDWIATARNFMLGDLQKEKAKIKKEFQGKIKTINYGKQTGGFTNEELLAAAERAAAGIH